MAIALTNVFGSAINVVVQPRDSERLYHGFSGAHGATTMFVGTRGRRITVTGTISYTAANYTLARIGAQAAIDAIEAYLWAGAADYSFYGCVFYAVVWDSFRLITDTFGKAFHWNLPGYLTVRFVATGRSLL